MPFAAAPRLNHLGGYDVDGWIGKSVVLYPATTSFGGETVDCIRVKESRGGPAAPPADAIKKLSTAFASLYASMPDDQKKVADEVFAQRAGKKIAMK